MKLFEADFMNYREWSTFYRIEVNRKIDKIIKLYCSFSKGNEVLCERVYKYRAYHDAAALYAQKYRRVIGTIDISIVKEFML